MASSLLVFAAILPVVVLCYFIYKKDVNKEPWKLLALIFVLGFLTFIPILIVELILDMSFSVDGVTNFVILFINMFVGVAIVEEGFKWIVTKKVGYDNKEFDEIYDVIVYAVFASLGFACIENILYVLQNGLGNAVMRAFLSIPGHTCFAVAMGYFLAKAKVSSINGNKQLYSKNLLLSVIVPALLHSTYNSLLYYMSNTGNETLFGVFLAFHIIMVGYCFNIVNKISTVQRNVNTNVSNGNIIKDNQGHIYYNTQNNNVNNMNNNNSIQNNGSVPMVPNFCPVCGKATNGANFCSACGFQLRK